MDKKPSDCTEIKGIMNDFEANQINFECTVNSTDLSSECNLTNTGSAIDRMCYSIFELSCGENKWTVSSAVQDKYFCLNKKRVPLGTSVSDQTVDYGVENQNTFNIVYNSNPDTLKEPPFQQVVIYDSNEKIVANLTNECKVVSENSSLTWTISKDKVPSITTGITYKVIVINPCQIEEDPKINLLVKESLTESENENMNEIENQNENQDQNNTSSYIKNSIFIIFIFFI